MPAAKVDTSHLEPKIRVRTEALALTVGPVNVVDAYAGLGEMWRTIRQRTDRDVSVLSVDKRPDAPAGTVRGDNLRVLRSLDLARFDLIDLDAYGTPAEQLAICASRAPDVPVVVTAIRDARAPVPHEVARRLGIPVPWCRRSPTVVARLGWLDLWDGYCHALGYRHRRGYAINDGGMMKRYDLLTR